MTTSPTDETDPMEGTRESVARAIYNSMRPQYVATVSAEGAVNGPRQCTWDEEMLLRKEYVYRYADAAIALFRPVVDALKAERDAYKKAKAENDERFMLERDEARRERDSLAGRLGEMERDRLTAVHRCFAAEARAEKAEGALAELTAQVEDDRLEGLEEYPE